MLLDRFIKLLSVLTSIFSVAFFLLLYAMHQGFDPGPYLLGSAKSAQVNASSTVTTPPPVPHEVVSTPLPVSTPTTPKASSSPVTTPAKPRVIVVKKTVKPSVTIVSTPAPLLVTKPTQVVTTTSTPSPTAPLASGALNQKAILDIVNIERAKQNLPALSFNTRLAAMAEGKAVDMINKQYFAHVSPTGVDVSQLSKTYGYEYIFLGENLAMGDFVSSSDVMNGWMNSPGHRANILNKNYTEIGISALEGNYQGRTVWYAVQEFGKPLSSCPSPDAALEKTVANEEVSVSAMEQTLTTMRAQIDQSAGDQAAYNALVENYNTMIDSYNNLVTKTKSDIALYNDGVNAFNLCLGQNVGTTTTAAE